MNIFTNKTNLISYTVNKANTSNCYLSVNNGEVIIDAPWYFSKKQIQNIIEEKSHWILEKIKEYQSQNLSSIDYGSVCILGANKTLTFHYSKVTVPTINLIDNNFNIILPYKFKRLQKIQLENIIIEKIYEKIAEQKLEFYIEKTRISLGLAPENIEIKHLNSNVLATCIFENKTIILDPSIVKYNEETINYIITHEFCHLKYKTHSKSFWKMVEKQIPNYEIYRNKLKDLNY